ncbi:PspC domain-containing protein [Candidatus Woesebacteria bacterium]|nr:PspC domain-containing protein [Candidatus Woesebacteria bacterium]
MAIKKNLYRSKKNRILAGIFGGLGEYFDVDPTLLRLAWLLVFVFTGFFPGLLAYLVAIIIVPLKSK